MDDPGDSQVTGRRGRRRIVLIGTAVLAVVVAGSVAWLLFAGDSPRSVTVDEARRRLGSSTMSTAPEGAFGPPAAGVYLYRGEGTERTSFPPLTEAQGPTMPATVTPDGDGCWRVRIDYNTHHWQDWRFCADTAGIVNTGGRSFARRDFGSFKIDNISTFTCPEPALMLWEGMHVGESRQSSCTGTSTAIGGSTTSAGPTTYVGDDDIEVEGRTIRARHLRYERTLTGAQEGTERAEWWVDPSTMLPIRNERQISVHTKVGAITVDYTEDAGYELTSLTPT